MAEALAATLATSVGAAVAKAVGDKISGYFSGPEKPQKQKQPRRQGPQQQQQQQKPRSVAAYHYSARGAYRARGGRGRGRGGRGSMQGGQRNRSDMDRVTSAPIKQNIVSKSFHRTVQGKRPYSEMYNGGVTFEGEFNIAEIKSQDVVTVGTDLTAAFVNPKFFKNSRLAYDSNVWQRFWFEEITLIYNPIVASTTAGSLAFGIIDNVALPAPPSGIEGLQALSNLRGSFSTSVSAVANSKHRFLRPTQPFLCIADLQMDALGTLSTQARIIIKAGSTLAANTTYGMLKMRYRVHFYEEIYPITKQIYSLASTFYLDNYGNVDKTACKMWYFQSRAPPDAFPKSIDTQWYSIILQQPITIKMMNWELSSSTTYTHPSGSIWIGQQMPNDTNITFLYDSEDDARGGSHSALLTDTNATPVSCQLFIVSRNAIENATFLAKQKEHPSPVLRHRPAVYFEEDEADDQEPEQNHAEFSDDDDVFQQANSQPSAPQQVVPQQQQPTVPEQQAAFAQKCDDAIRRIEAIMPFVKGIEEQRFAKRFVPDQQREEEYFLKFMDNHKHLLAALNAEYQKNNSGVPVEQQQQKRNSAGHSTL